MLELFPYQTEGAQWLAPKDQALLADDMGLGKSAQAIRAADIVGAQNILVICPAAVRVNWEREFERFSPFDRPCMVVMNGKVKELPAGVVICSYDLAVPLAHILKAKRWDLVILDEAHYLKERSAKRTKAIYGAGKKRPGVIASAARVWRLTGTPAPNDASELWTQLHYAGHADEPYWDFVFRYCSGFDSNYGYKITGIKNVPELKKRLEPFMLRRKKEDVLKDLPPIIYQEVTVERSKVELDPVFYERITLDGGEAKFMEKLRAADTTLKAALASIGVLGYTETRSTDKLAVLEGLAPSMITLRRYIGMAKLPQCIEIIKADLKENPKMKIVLFGVHQCVIEGARDALKRFGAVTLYGGTSAETRQKNIDKFMHDPKCRVFIGNIQAAGTGITLTSASEVAFLEQDWVPANNAQATMRVHRIGQTAENVRVRVFSMHKSVDEQVARVLMQKSKELVKLF